jgi:hypothetical protein
MTDALSGELHAMVQVEAALKDLKDDERDRVMQWAIARFRIQANLRSPASAKMTSGGETPNDDTGTGAEGGAVSYEDLATFYDAARPDSDTDKALVVAYWLQVHEGAADIDAQSVNTQLKHLGHGIGNVTRAFEGLKSLRPALIVQLRKEGSTKQARKRFKVTAEGRKAVEQMVSAE